MRVPLSISAAKALLVAIHVRSRGTYGARFRAELSFDHNVSCSGKPLQPHLLSDRQQGKHASLSHLAVAWQRTPSRSRHGRLRTARGFAEPQARVVGGEGGPK